MLACETIADELTEATLAARATPRAPTSEMLGPGSPRSLPLAGSGTKCAGDAAPWSPYAAAGAATPSEPTGLCEPCGLTKGSPEGPVWPEGATTPLPTEGVA